ncbi:shikimate 5-dehydrogenase [Mycetocola miduiensis]|uniref:Shikimate dehydrogenase n=1 Tax=Mycetocola miduiensis TaxID=995034 RepID=A0A1I5C5L7_9MICO|nr:shikimate 5-dehydrogenase [Mycetocola miduiensis]SFN82082.1 shikimate dehydrogenase [Mycetocola miduiensis]
MPILNKDMQVCISLSGRPSNLGTRFHNYLYDLLGLNFVYKAFTTDDLEGAVRGIRALGIRGCSVSMPFKEAIIPFLDELGPSARAIESVNTVVNDNGRLRALNTDFEAVATILREGDFDRTQPVLVRGSGGMGKAVVAAFREVGFDDLTVLARNADAGRALADKYGYSFARERPDREFGMLVNVTPLGMQGSDSEALAFDEAAIRAASTVFDVVAFPSRTPLIRRAEELGKVIRTGAEVVALQAALQFKEYTGVSVSADLVREASEFSRAEA